MPNYSLYMRAESGWESDSKTEDRLPTSVKPKLSSRGEAKFSRLDADGRTGIYPNGLKAVVCRRGPITTSTIDRYYLAVLSVPTEFPTYSF